MAVATRKITTTAQIERLLALFRIEQAFRPYEILEELIAKPKMLKATTRAAIWKKLNQLPCGDRVVFKLADSAVREVVERGHAPQLEAFIDELRVARFRCEHGLDQTPGARDDERDLFVARMLDVKDVDPDGYAALRATGLALAESSERSKKSPLEELVVLVRDDEQLIDETLRVARSFAKRGAAA